MRVQVDLEAREPLADVLTAVARGERPSTLRVFRPPRTVAFGRLDALRPGYPAAIAAAERHGFTALLRAPGGHAAPYDEGCLVVEEVIRERAGMTGIQSRFEDRGRRFAGLLQELGVDARVGEVPGEYCPGRWSVNARGAVKLVGTAQRVVREAWAFGSVIVVESDLRAVVADVYAALGLQVDPSTVGSVAAEAPGVRLEDLRSAVLTEFAITGA